MINGTGGGPYPVGREVTVTAAPAKAGEEFDDWEGDVAILRRFHKRDHPSIDDCSRRYYYRYVLGLADFRGDGDQRDW